MRNIVLSIALAALPLAPTPQDAKQGDAHSAEDRKVLTAVIDHTIRPEVQRLTRLGPSAVLFIIDHTAATCDRFQSPRSQPFCTASVEVLRGSQAIGFPQMAIGPLPAEAIPSADHRDELIASIRARNAEHHTTPVSEGVDIKVVEAPPVTKTPAGGTSTSYTVFSLPGYSSAGHAAVYGFYDCGGRCGTAWLWLLEKRGSDWQVRSRYVLGMF